MTQDAPCVDCGKPAWGERCRRCNGLFIKRQHAEALADADHELLAMRDIEKLSGARIGARLGITPVRVYARIRDARRRERIRQGEAA